MPALSPSIRGKLILAFASVHLVYLMCGVLPERWRGPLHLSSAMNFYGRLTRSQQVWNMFETIPNMHSLKARLVVQEGTQKARAEGMVLPGLRRFSEQEHPRLGNWMVNVVFNPTRGVFREAYMRSAAEALLRTGRYSPRARMTLEVVPAYTRSMAGVRALKQIAVERPSLLGPFELGTLVARNTPAPSTP